MHLRMDIVSYTENRHAQVRAGARALAWMMFAFIPHRSQLTQRMLSWQQPARWLRAVDLPLKVVTYSTLVRTCSNAWKWEVVLRLLEEVEAVSLQPNAALLNAATGAVAIDFNLEHLLRCVNDLRGQSFRPDAFTYSAS